MQPKSYGRQKNVGSSVTKENLIGHIHDQASKKNVKIISFG